MFEFTAVHGEQPRNPAVNHGHGKQSEAAAGWAEFVLHRSQNRKAAAGEKIVASRARGKLHLQVEQTREIVTCGSMILVEIVEKMVESRDQRAEIREQRSGGGARTADAAQGGLSLVGCSSGIEPLEAEVPARREVLRRFSCNYEPFRTEFKVAFS